MVVGVIADRIDVQGMSAHVLKHKYLPALTDIAGVTPVILPSVGKDFRLEDYPFLDGVVLTGSLSAIAPACYGAEVENPDEIFDRERDQTAFTIINSALALDMPLFGICRGFEEINVALGGTLSQNITGHESDKTLSLEQQYETHPHKVIVQKGGVFEKLGLPSTFGVNTLHHQGIDRLADGLRVEAIADDGLIEAISMPGQSFFVGVQWHPESDYRISPVSVKLFEAFHDKMQERAFSARPAPSFPGLSQPGRPKAGK